MIAVTGSAKPLGFALPETIDLEFVRLMLQDMSCLICLNHFSSSLLIRVCQNSQAA